LTNSCPSCRHPIDQDETQHYDAGSAVTRCSNCGVVFSENESTGTYQQVVAAKGNRIANFKLLRMLGQGGFGAVWLAEDQNLGRQVALKLPKASQKDSQLLHEAQTAARLRHANIVSIYEVGVASDQVFIASEFIDGEDLRDELARGRPAIPRAVQLMTTLARAVHHAHEHGVVHRDIKPANIILNAAGDPFVTDFGIAKQLAVDETISTDGQVVGTISYMSPEQAKGSTRETDRADIYALGVILFEMLTEYRPLRGNARAIIHKKLYEDPPSPRRLVPSLPKDLETICLKCLEREPAKRYASAADLADELDRFAQGIPIKARPVSRGEKAWRWCRRKPAIASLLIGFLLSMTVGLAGVSFFWMQASNSAEQTRRSLYRTQMNLASKLWASGDVAGLQRTLANYKPGAAAADLRDFEWHYFNRLTEPFVQVVNHGDVVTDVAVSRDGKLFAATGADRMIRVWNATSGKLVRTLEPRSGRIRSIEFSPVDDRLASAHSDGLVRLWNPLQHDHTTKEVHHGPGLNRTRFSPDGRSLVTAGNNGVARLWRVSESEPIADLSQPRKRVQDVRFSPDGDRIAVATQDGVIAIWDLNSEEYGHSLKTNSQVLAIAFGDGGQTLVTGSYGGTLQLWQVKTGQRVRSSQVIGGAIGDIEFLASVDLLAVVTTANELRLFDGSFREVRALATHTLTHGLLAQSRDGGSLVVGSGDGSVKLLNVASLQRRDALWHDSHVRDIAFASGETHLATCAGDGSVWLWELASGEGSELAAASGREMLALAASPTGNLLMAAGMNREIQVFSLEKRTPTTSIPLPYSGFSSLAVSASGGLLACGSRGGSVRVYEHGSFLEPKFELSESDAQVNDLLFSPLDNALVVAYSDGRIAFVNCHDGTVSSDRLQVASSPLALAFCYGGKQLVVGTQNGEIEFYDVATHESRQVVKAHSSRINALAVFPNDRRLVSGGRDRELRIWDIPTGELVTSLPGHNRQVFAITVSSDGGTIISAGLAGDVRLWRSEP
jgi:WD40 repeat protein/serine/threonine protein kinase